MRIQSSFVHMCGLAATATLLAFSGTLAATTISEFSTADLVRHAQLGGRMSVLKKASIPGGSMYRLRIDDLLVGSLLGDELDLTLDDSVEGMPQLQLGKSYVLFLSLANRYERIIALIPGTIEERNGLLFSYGGQPTRLESVSSVVPSMSKGEGAGVPVTVTAHRLIPADDPMSYAEFRSSLLRVRDELLSAGALLRWK
ncbi:MAG: hypothetical protein IPN03_23005 [Holophagales bacterium]|nr:hypothetical protein [Holophagales bacterium]